MSVKVFIVDDHPLFRLGLRHSLAQEEDIEVVGEASDGF
ncbi:MAG: response regulator transcription factor, partial [Syntrophobacteraceae bacterium]|nr:response regulator transcription factor [Syntrophobacteraceae bacterium]